MYLSSCSTFHRVTVFTIEVGGGRSSGWQRGSIATAATLGEFAGSVGGARSTRGTGTTVTEI